MTYTSFTQIKHHYMVKKMQLNSENLLKNIYVMEIKQIFSIE
jgi:hypothetical protein